MLNVTVLLFSFSPYSGLVNIPLYYKQNQTVQPMGNFHSHSTVCRWYYSLARYWYTTIVLLLL